MVKKICFTILLFLSSAIAGVVVPDEYEVSDDKEVSYIYGAEYKESLSDIKAYQEDIIKVYKKEFGFALDDRLRVGLATSNNQIANGFSTQIPFNMQLFYGAGASYIDYFCFSSWLKTLLIHETAHNFQLNPKENSISKVGHTLFGNNPVAFLGFLPIFPIPNITESPFILEGNAVMNESRFGNGGRLFSGYALAEVVALAKAGEITPELMYNSTLEFPYGEHFYLVGGFFQQFLVKRYGVERVNSYFKRYATQAFPFFTNSIFKEQFGKSFEVLLEEFVEEIKEKHALAKELRGEVVATSKLFVPLNGDSKEIYTLIGDRKSEPKLLKIDRKTRKVSYISDSFREGEVFKVNGEYYTQSSAKTSPIKIEMGLFDSSGFLKEGTGGKAIQGYTKSGKEVYVDVKSSLEAPKVYVDDKFYTTSYSSVHVDKDDLYYFKQDDKKRTLFKNQIALYSFDGHYGFVVDVDEQGGIYFIGSSEHGSTIYRFANGEIKRVNEADNIIDFKLLDDQKALAVTVGAEGYSYLIISIGDFKSSNLYAQKIEAVEKENILTNKPFGDRNQTLLKSKSYNSLTRLEYSYLAPYFYYSDLNGFEVNAIAMFTDPLWQNQLYVIGSHNKKREVIGASYDNSAFRLNFGASYYRVFKNSNYNNSDYRDSGYELYATFPWLEQGYWSIFSTLAFSKPYDSIYREPLTLSLDILNKKRYGFSKYANSLNGLNLFVSDDRDNSMYGAKYSFKHDLAWQSYIGLKGAYLKSDKVDFLNEKGIELDDTFSSIQSDLGTLDIPSFTFKSYAKEAKMAELSLAKVFDGSLYFYSFPISLQRETLYVKQRHYEIDFNRFVSKSYDETILGTEFDLLFLHKMGFPLSVEWIYNRDAFEPNKVRILFGGSF